MSVLYVDKNVRLSVKNNQISIKSINSEKQIIIPINEIKTILIDDFFTITKNFFELCNKNNITLIMTDSKHYPSITLVNVNNPFFKMHDVVKRQSDLDKSENLKISIWKKFLFIKVLNYMSLSKSFKINVFRKICKTNDKLKLLQIEGSCANNYYKVLFGNAFKRKTKYFVDKDVLNSFLNYGYALLKSKIAHYLTINGLLPYFSIFHSAENNNFALADDIIECYRYAVDYLAAKNISEFKYAEVLDKNLKKLALSVFDLKMEVKNKGWFSLNDAIDLAIKDYRRFLLTKDLSYLNTFKTKLY